MRIGLFAAVVLGGVVLTGGTALADDVYSGIEVGLRTGYAIPFGNSIGSPGGGVAAPNLSDTISGDIPIWIDAGYRFASPNLFVGAYFQYGIGFNGSTLTQGAGCQCSTNVVMYGLQAHYHFLPDQTIDPWVGYGIGMESANESGQNSSGGSLSGWDYGILQVGADYRGLVNNLSVGPLVMFGFGQYNNLSQSQGGQSQSASIPQQAMHEWLTIGIRGAYDIKIF